jgi:type VI secretion system protein ImpH
MGSPIGQPDPPVRAEIPSPLRERPWDFSFFQAVRLLQRTAGGSNPIGSFDAPANEAVRLATNPSIGFPAAEIQALEIREDKPPKMTVNFFGLDGAQGVLPMRYTEMVLDRLYARDATLRDFLDIFNHRMVSLLYRAWEKYRFPVAYERTGQDAFTGYLLDLIGLGTPGLPGRQSIPDQSLLLYTGLLSQFPRSAASFRSMLANYFDAPVEIEPFAGGWRTLDEGSRTSFQDGLSRSEQLGVGMVLGDEVWDQQSIVRVRLGPLSLEQYRSFLPDGSAHEPLKTLARFFCGGDLDVEVQLILKREEAPRFSLDAPGTEPPKLGWIGWVFGKPLDRDPCETVFRLWE